MKTPIKIDQKFVRNGSVYKITRRWMRSRYSEYSGKKIADGKFQYTSHVWYAGRKIGRLGYDFGMKRAAWHTMYRWHDTLGDAYRSIMSDARRA